MYVEGITTSDMEAPIGGGNCGHAGRLVFGFASRRRVERKRMRACSTVTARLEALQDARDGGRVVPLTSALAESATFTSLCTVCIDASIALVYSTLMIVSL
jgi:hypothetical protein